MKRFGLATGIFLAVFGIGYCTTCDKLPWRRDVDVIEHLKRQTGKNVLYKSLDENAYCGMASYYQFCNDLGLYTFTTPNISNGNQFKYTCEGDGLWGKYDWKKEKFQIRKVYDYSEDKNGFAICLFSCDCNKVDFESFDCFVTTKNKIPFVKSTVAQAKIILRKDQSWKTCDELTNLLPAGTQHTAGTQRDEWTQHSADTQRNSPQTKNQKKTKPSVDLLQSLRFLISKYF